MTEQTTHQPGESSTRKEVSTSGSSDCYPAMNLPPAMIQSLVDFGQDALTFVKNIAAFGDEFKMQFPQPFPESLEQEYISIRVKSEDAKKLIELFMVADEFASDCSEATESELLEKLKG